MTNSNQINMEFALPLPITQTAIAIADRFAQQQPNSHKAEQVRHNTLAVHVVHDYLQMMGIPSHLSGDSWNVVTRMMADVADLEIEGLGRLECRPILEDTELTCSIPSEVQNDRIGYVVVHLDKLHYRANLLGFVKTVDTEALPLTQLRSPEELLEHLDRLQYPVLATQPNLTNPDVAPFTRLSQWLQGTFETGWQTLESLLNASNTLSYGFRGELRTPVQNSESVQRAKQIDLHSPTVEQSLILVVDLIPQLQQRDIQLRLYSDTSSPLPPNIHLAVLNQAGNIFLEASSEAANDYLQLKFWGEVGEMFTILVELEDAIATELFVI